MDGQTVTMLSLLSLELALSSVQTVVLFGLVELFLLYFFAWPVLRFL
jgi:hypothetical protein